MCVCVYVCVCVCVFVCVSVIFDSRFKICIRHIHNYTEAVKCKSGPLHEQCNYMEYKHKRIFINIGMEKNK